MPPQESKAFSVFHEHAHKLHEYLIESSWTDARILHVLIIISFSVYFYVVIILVTRQLLGNKRL